MSVFQPVILGWDGQEHTVPSNKVMGLIETVESVITQYELSMALSDPRSINKSKIAKAYAAALQYAGCIVSTEMVYRELFDATEFERIVQIINGLLAMMFPEDAYTADPKKNKLTPTRQPQSPTKEQPADGSVSSQAPTNSPAGQGNLGDLVSSPQSSGPSTQ